MPFLRRPALHPLRTARLLIFCHSPHTPAAPARRAYPQWVTCSPGTLQNCSDKTNDPYGYPEQLAMYVTKWVAGAKNTYGLDIDYIGSWNERAYNIPYLKQLRASLDAANFSNTKIIAPDSGWDIAHDILADPALASAVHGIGAHYPGQHSTSDAVATGKPLWASEDDSVSFW